MKTLLILGGGKEQVAAIAAAKAKAIRTVVLDMNPKADGRALADEFHLVSTRDREALLKFARDYKSPIHGVITIASDIPHMVAIVAEALGHCYIYSAQYPESRDAYSAIAKFFQKHLK